MMPSLKQSDIILVSICSIVLIFLHLLHTFNPTLFIEHQPVQNFQSMLLFLAGITALAASFSEDWRPFRWLYISIGLFALFVFLEEIDYGQAIFHFDTPLFISRHGYERDFSLHHLLFGIVDLPVHFSLLVFSSFILFTRKFKINIPLLKFFPHLTNFKYWILLAFCILFSISGILVFVKPFLESGLTLPTLQDNLGRFKNITYQEVIETVEYTALLIMVSFKPKEL